MDNDNDHVEVKVLHQGDAFCGDRGYMLKRSENVAAFYLDGWGRTNRIYPISTCSVSWHDNTHHKYPSMTIEDGQEECDYTEICFPEFEGWSIHSVSGGKTMSICLTKD